MRWSAEERIEMVEDRIQPSTSRLHNDGKGLRISSRALDRAEQIVVVVLFLYLCQRLWPAGYATASLPNYLLLISEGAVVLFLLIRKPTAQISMRPQDWVIAAGGTFLALCIAPGGQPIAILLAALLILSGTVVHIGAKISLNRSFGLVAANRGVKQRGLYRFVRHPMYAGYIASHAGFLLAAPSVWNALVYASVWTLLVLRIRAEERILFDDPLYRAFAQRVRWRLLPGVY